MKKVFWAVIGFAALAAVSCVNDENPDYVPPPTTVSGVVINEVYTFSDQSEADNLDWIELYNTTDEDIDLTGVLMWEGGGPEEAWAFPKGTVIKAKGYIVVDCDKYGLLNDPVKYPAWGLSKGPDEFVVLANSDLAVIDEVQLPSMNENESYGRVTDGADEWQIFQNATYGVKNEGPARGQFVNTCGLYINEVYTDNSDEFSATGWDASVDFIEFYNSTDVDFDLSGYKVYDDKHEEETSYVFPSGTVVPANGFLAVDVYKENTEGPAFGLGAGGDWVFLYDASGEKADEIEIPSITKESGNRDKGYTFGRKPDGSTTLVWFTEATKGASNNNAPVLEGWEPEPEQPEQPEQPGTPSTPEEIVPSDVVFNELCGNKAYDGQKFIELYNKGNAEIDLNGWKIRKYAADATDVAGKYNNCWVAVEGIKITAGGYLVLASDQTDPTLGFDAGLSAKKGLKVELVDASGNVVDRFVRGEDTDPFEEESLAENKNASFSRVPNGSGDWAYAVPTPGEANGESEGEIEGYKKN